MVFFFSADDSARVEISVSGKELKKLVEAHPHLKEDKPVVRLTGNNALLALTTIIDK